MTLVIDDAPEIRGFNSPEVDLSRIEINKYVDLEEALVALLAEPVAKPAHMADRRRTVLLRREPRGTDRCRTNRRDTA